MIQLFKASIDVENAMTALRPVLESGWLGLGKKTEEFERAVADYLGCREFIATNSCTAALHLALHALQLPRGRHVATTPITFVSTNMVVLYEQLTPVFVDVDEATGTISAEALARLLGRTSIGAILYVHTGGFTGEFEAISELARRYGIPIIEDCAHAFGSYYEDGWKVGSTDNLCCWSFHAVKNLPMGDGGGISTNDPELAARLRKRRWLGISKSTSDRFQESRYRWDYDVESVGYKYHMDDVHAAIGLAQLETVDRHNRRRRDIARRYSAEIRTQIPMERHGLYRSACHFLPMFFADRDAVTRRLDEAEIQYGMHYRRNDKYAPFREFTNPSLMNAQWWEDHELTLPMHPGLTSEEVSRVIDAVNG